jgi:hypothetical protein
MTKWLRDRWSEPSTRAGLASLTGTLAAVLPAGSTGQLIAGGVTLLLGGSAASKAG